MKNIDLFTLAYRAIVINKLRSFLTMLGIVIGVFAIIMLVSIGTGLQDYITKQFSSLGSNLIYIVPGKIGAGGGPGDFVNKLLISDSRNIQSRLTNIAQVAPVIMQSSTIKYLGKTDDNVQIAGTTANYTQTILNIVLERGNYFSIGQERSGAKVAVIGATVVEKLFPNTDPIGKIITIGNNRYTVIGSVKKRGSTFGVDQDNIVGIPITAAQQQFGVSNVKMQFIYRLINQNLFRLLNKQQVRFY
jgi:putative ABC transport system permease protein